MSDPITATLQVVQLGISAAKATASIAGLWEARRARANSTTGSNQPQDGSQEEQSGRRQGAKISDVLLVLSVLGQRLLMLDVINIDKLPEAFKAARSAMLAVDAEDDDVGYEVDQLDPILQHLIAASYVFCAACHPMPVWHGFGCGVLNNTAWSSPERPNMWTQEVDNGIAFLKSVPGIFDLLKKSPSRIGRTEPYYDETDPKSQKLGNSLFKDMLKQFEKNGLPPPLPPNDGIQIRSWWMCYGTHGGTTIYADCGHDYKPAMQYQLDVGRFLYAWTIGEHADLRPWEAIAMTQDHIGHLAEWMEGLNGVTFKILRDTELDWSKIKLKSSTKKFMKAQTGNEHGIDGGPFLLVRNPDPMAGITKSLDVLQFISVPVKKQAAITATSVPSTPVSPTTPLTPTSPISPSGNGAGGGFPIVPIMRKAVPTSPVQTAPVAPVNLPPTPLPSPPSKTTADPMNDLPPGWEERMMPDGRVYYIDHTTRSTSWTRPVHFSAPPSYDASV